MSERPKARTGQIVYIRAMVEATPGTGMMPDRYTLREVDRQKGQHGAAYTLPECIVTADEIRAALAGEKDT